jgi:membrane fusion protein
VQSISATVLRPAEVQAAVELKEPMYRVIIRLEKNSIGAYGKQYHVQSGMALKADIVLERRSFAAWLLDPIMAMRGQL